MGTESSLPSGCSLALHGVALDPAGKPLALVDVTIRSLDGSVGRNTITNGDGIFIAERLQPGPYQITATKDGVASAPVTTVEIIQNQTARPYLVLTAAVAPAAAAPAAATPAAAPAAPLTVEQELEAMKERIAVLEA